MKTDSGQRLWGLDLLKILCMLMIISLHFISHGGLSDYFADSSVNNYVMQLLRSVSICSVNVFVLVSGYFMVSKSTLNFKRLLSIALAVWFYAWVYFALTYFLNLSDFGIKEIMKSLLPISFKLYWFPSCYLCLCLLSPFLNKLLHSMSLKMSSFFIGVLFVLLSVWSDLAVMADPMGVSKGYSVAWFIFLYCLAGFIGIHKDSFFPKMQKRHWGWTFLIATLLIFGVDAVIGIMSNYIGLIERYDLAHHFTRYCSVLVVVQSVALFMFFRSIEKMPGALCKISNFIAPLTFGVYLVHDNANIRNIIYFKLLGLNELPKGLIALPLVCGYILALFAACCVVEFIRKKLFYLIENSKLYKNFCNKIQAKIDSILLNGGTPQ